MNKYHFIGLGGIGMSALAEIVLKKKQKVKGSDVQTNDALKRLKEKGAKIRIGHKKENVEKDDIVVYSTAIDKKNNEEFLQAQKYNLKAIHRSELLDQLVQGHDPLLVAGTHGKTTTTALLSSVLLEAKKDPSFVIGGILNSLNTNGYLGSGNYFVVEADESDGSFIKSNSYGAIVTNLEEEHMSYWKDYSALENAFVSFFKKAESKRHIFWCRDDENLNKINPKGISYGFSKKADLRCSNIKIRGFKTYFDIHFEKKEYKDICLNLVGNHNVLNASAVFGLCLNLNIDEQVIRRSFFKFSGVKRRLEQILEHRKTLFIDDYAHHPTEIKACLASLRKAVEEKKITAVFQPHRYSRMKDVIYDLKNCFEQADEVIVTDIYSSGEQPVKGISADKIVEIIQHLNVKYVKNENLEDYVINNIQPYDVVIALGAGDISNRIRKIADRFAAEKEKIKIAIMFGGRSNEHEISIRSCRNYITLFDRDIFKLEFFKITKDGRWLYGNEDLIDSDNGKIKTDHFILKLKKCDFVFPIFHGPFGEDGSVQGFLDTLNVSYIGSDFFGSSISMDKIVTKKIAKYHEIPIIDFVELDVYEYQNNKEVFIDNIIKKIEFPICIKPAHLGSSIAIKFAKDKKELTHSIDYCFQYDNKIICEKNIYPNELQTAVFGSDIIKIGLIGKVFTKGDFFDYEKKYLKSNVTSQVPAEISDDMHGKIIRYSKILYKACSLNGFARIDFFIDKNNKIYFNEINPIPGFSSANSLFIKMIEKQGYTKAEIVDLFLISANHKKRKIKKLEKST